MTSLVNMHIFLESHTEEMYHDFCEAIKALLQHGALEVSVSPMREYGEFGEIYVTLQIDDLRINEILDYMSDAWDGPKDDCMTTSFTSHVFHPSINTIYFTMFD